MGEVRRMFGLEKDYFALNPREEYRAYFVKAKKEEVNNFVEDIRRTIAGGKAPKFVVYGALGLGKTHFLYHVKNRLEDIARCIYVEMPPSHRRTRFTDLYGVIMREIGRSFILNLLEKSVVKAKEQSKTLGEFVAASGDICDIIQNALEMKLHFLLWRYLCGEKLRSTEAIQIEAIRQQLGEDEAVAILNIIALLISKVEIDKRPILLLIDEIENTRLIGGDSATLFIEANRSLTDESSHVGIIFAATVRAVAELPRTITEKSVASRIGYTNFIPFKDYDETSLHEFISDAIGYRRQKDFDAGLAARTAQSQTGEHVTPQNYPFTEEAVNEVIATVSELWRKGKTDAIGPRETLQIMDAALRKANGSPIISSEVIVKVRNELAAKLELIRT
jgi:Cdc6-like AAA superfamily ATPase